MKKTFKLILVALTVTMITGCCLIDYRPTIEKVAKPTLKELEAFYKINKRFPNTKERDVMLEKAGCEMRGDICMFEGEELTISRSGEIIPNKYYITIEYQDKETLYSMASCGFGIDSESYISSVGCTKRPCITIRQ